MVTSVASCTTRSRKVSQSLRLFRPPVADSSYVNCISGRVDCPSINHAFARHHHYRFPAGADVVPSARKHWSPLLLRIHIAAHIGSISSLRLQRPGLHGHIRVWSADQRSIGGCITSRSAPDHAQSAETASGSVRCGSRARKEDSQCSRIQPLSEDTGAPKTGR